MNKAKLFDYLDGFCAWDAGATDSGIKDDKARNEVKAYLHTLKQKELEVLMGEFIIDHYLSPRACEAGYGLESCKEFIEWFEQFYERY